jgi:Uma2 family endonuclease
MAQSEYVESHQSTGQSSRPTRVTLEGWLDLISETPCEVIDGEIVPMSPQHKKSSWVAQALFVALNTHVVASKAGVLLIETAFAPDVVEDEEIWLRGSIVPDLAFISKDRYKDHQQKFGDQGAYRIAPDLAVEVVSPSDRFATVTRKVALYLQYGVRLVWVIDPQYRKAHVFTPENADGHILSDTDTLNPSPVIGGWSITLKALLDTTPDLD